MIQQGQMFKPVRNTRVPTVLFDGTTREQVAENARAVALLELGSGEIADVHPRRGDEREPGALSRR